MLRAIRFVKDARIARGSGLLDFEDDLKTIRPDVLIVNSDGSIAEKRTL